MKRVLLTVHKFFPEHRAGTEVLTLKVAQELQRRGYETLVVTANPPDLDARHAGAVESSDYTYDGVKVHVIQEALRLKGYTFRHEFSHPQIAEHFARLLQQFKPDIMHIFHCQNLSADIVETAKQSKIPVVASLTDFWFVCPVVQLKRPDGALCRGPKMMAGNCLTCYTPQLFPPPAQVMEAIEKKLPAAGKVLKKMPAPVRELGATIATAAFCAGKLPAAAAATMQRPAFLQAVANQLDAIMVPTKLMEDIFVENGIRADLIKRVAFGLDTKPLLCHQQKSASSAIRVGFIGTIFEHKGLDLLVEAFQQLPVAAAIQLKIYGDPEQFPDYGRAVEKSAKGGANADKIQFFGTFPNAQLGEVLSNIDILAVPSRWYENTPLVIQSAFATCTPVLATDLGGMSELVKHDRNGLLFKLNDARSLAEQLLRIIEDPTLLPKLRAGISPERTVEQMVDEIETVYEAVLPRQNAASPPLSSPAAAKTVIS
jgi:glycosyltransferase involved in cell wall biosynthesis